MLRQSKMKIKYVFITVLILIFLTSTFSFSASAHPASEMSISYNIEKELLNVSITHRVSDSSSHYIDQIIIYKNGEIYASLNYTSQPTNNSFYYSYDISANLSDTLEVFTHCNLGGTLTEQLIVSTEDTKSNQSDLSIQNIVYYDILGIPFIVHLGIFTLFLFIVNAGLPVITKRTNYNIPVKWHIRLAYVSIILGVIHGIFGFLMYI